MAIITFLLLFISFSPATPFTSPYLSSPTTLFNNYQKMTTNFRIYIYDPPNSFSFTTQSEFNFNYSLSNSPFITKNPEEALMFFLPFPSDFPTRSLSALIKDIRFNFPYWDRTLGADHFFVSRAGVGPSSDRNIVELKKNSVQISGFPTTSGNFIPHKDITLPPANPSPISLPQSPAPARVYLGYYYHRRREEQVGSSLVNQLNGDPRFLIQSEPFLYAERLAEIDSKFCLFVYGGVGGGGDDVAEIGVALGYGCVPVVITDRPIHDLPLMDVLRWSEIAVFVGPVGGADELKGVLDRIGDDKYQEMRSLGVTAAQHFVWNLTSQPYDAFHMVMYQLWLRRHAIRYARREL